jgi:hypothetical protein
LKILVFFSFRGDTYDRSSTGNNELVGYLEPYKIRQWIAENPGKAAKLPSYLQKLRTIKETDNPVVMIAKLKD